MTDREDVMDEEENAIRGMAILRKATNSGSSMYDTKSCERQKLYNEKPGITQLYRYSLCGITVFWCEASNPAKGMKLQRFRYIRFVEMLERHKRPINPGGADLWFCYEASLSSWWLGL